MNTPTPITDAHKGLWTKLFNLAHDEIFDDFEQSDGPAHQLIADSEARAVAALTIERDQLRAEVKSLKKKIKDDNFSYGCELRDPYGTIWEQATADHARAEKAEADLAAAKERLRSEAMDDYASIKDLQRELTTLTAELTVALANWNGALERAMKAEADLVALAQCHDDNCRAVVKIAAELATERARLDSGTILLTVAGERVWHCGVDLRADIDAAKKEGAK